MDNNQRVQILQSTYVGVLADTVRQYTQEGILPKVTAAKRKDQFIVGKQQAVLLGITKPEEVFTKLAEIFNCTTWKIIAESNGFVAEALECRLLTACKRLGTGCPCNIYCLNPMEAMVQGVDAKLSYTVMETLWAGKQCRIEVRD